MARRFRFRLETVRKIRERERDAQRRVVAERVRAVATVRRRIEVLSRGLVDNENRSRETRPTGSVDVHVVRRHLIHGGWLNDSIESVREELGLKQTELAGERGKLAEAATRLKVIEKLRERQSARHGVLVAREEQAAMDEAAQHAYLRQRKEPDTPS